MKYLIVARLEVEAKTEEEAIKKLKTNEKIKNLFLGIAQVE